MLVLLVGCQSPEKVPQSSYWPGSGGEEGAGGEGADGGGGGGETACPPEGEGLILGHSLEGALAIYMDEGGMRHVWAGSDRDLFWASGYLQARERLWAIEMTRRSAQGRLAEVLGEGSLGSDRSARVIGFGRDACAALTDVAALNPDGYNLAVAYVSGLNARVEELRAGVAEAPPEFAAYGAEPTEFSLMDIMAMGRRVHFGFSGGLENDLLYTLGLSLVGDFGSFPLFEPVSPDFIAVEASGESLRPRRAHPDLRALDPERVRGTLSALSALRRDHRVWPGSNNWAVSGSATDNGRPYLANDPHTALQSPSLVYAQHLNSVDAGGSFDVAGFGFAGMPGVHLGHNASMAWAATTAQMDVLDLFDVEQREGAVVWGGEEVPAEVVTERILVREEDGSSSEELLEVTVVPGHGVLLPSEVLPVPVELVASGGLMLAWTGYAHGEDLLFYFDLARARDRDDFEAVLERQRTGAFNWVFADAEGWRYRVHADVPLRTGEGAEPYRVMSGAAHGWSGMVDSALLPRLTDEGRSFVATTNNDPLGLTEDGDPLDDGVYLGSWFDPGWRAARSEAELERLTAAGGVSREDMAALQQDLRSGHAERLLPLLAEAVGAIGEDPALAEWEGRAELPEALARLQTWDQQMGAGSEDAALYRIFAFDLCRRLFTDDLSILFETVEDEVPEMMMKWALLALERGEEGITEGQERAHLLGALAAALEEMAARGEPTWSALHVDRFLRPGGEPLDVPVGGDDTTLFYSQCGMWTSGVLDEQCISTQSSLFRVVYGFDESGRPVATWNAANQVDGEVEAWRTGSYHTLPFSRVEVEAAALSSEAMEP